jgi:uncharacterized protein DUF6328
MAKSARSSTQKETLEQIAQQAIEESRMVLPGIQTLFGFQLIAGFNQGFRDIGLTEQRLHFVSLLLIAVSIALIMTPVAYHRIVEQGEVSRFFVSLISWLIPAAMVTLMLALSLEVYVVGMVIIEDRLLSTVIAVVMLALFATAWFAFPLAMKQRRRRGGT